MDNFMDKLAQKYNAQEMIRANAQAEASEMQRLQEQVAAYEGILQDIHWSQGGIGYFPSYALGSAFGAQFFHKMKEEFDVDETLEDGKLDKITTWLKENIHQHGGFKNAKELLRDVTGEELNTKYYVDYLTEKYSKLYNL